MQPLLSPEAIRDRLTRSYRNRHRQWLGGGGTWPLTLPLGAPTEADAQQHGELIRDWIAAWQNWRGEGELVCTERRWRTLGQQRLPERLVLRAPEHVAAWAGESERWRNATERRERFARRWPSMARRLSRHFDFLADSADADIDCLELMLAWLDAHPRSDLYPRELPVPGLHSKWLERNRTVIFDLMTCLRPGDAPESDFFQLCGLRQPPALMRVRVLDANLRAQLGGLSDISAPIADLAAIPIRPARVFIVENLQTGLAFPDVAGAVVLMRMGYAVDALGRLPWIAGADCCYWGDIDTHGIAILSRARAYLPALRSMFMDERTLLSHRAFWVKEDTQHSALELPHLDDLEQALYRALKDHRWGLNVRFEQERLAWSVARTQIEQPSSPQSEQASSP
jgi:hypothetical protein